MNVTITGPNTHGGMFHVHRTGCADLTKRLYRVYRGFYGERYEEEHASRQSVVEAIYSDQIHSDNAGDPVWGHWSAYDGDFHFFPCTDKLPNESPED